MDDMLRAPTSDAGSPPMGWNSWDCYGTTVTEAEVLANAKYMSDNLLSFGWDTVVVDIDWSDPTARAHGYNEGAPLQIDRWGRLHPDPVRFPSSAGGAGFKPLADRVHSLGLRFGIHVMRGVPRVTAAQRAPVKDTKWTADQIVLEGDECAWNPDMFGLDHSHPASQAYYDSILALYAEWGIDFLKVDDMLWPYRLDDIEAFARALRRSGRPMQLSLSPGRDLSLARLDHLRAHADMWRVCDDLWDRWDDVVANFARFARWAPSAGPGGWPDGDMLPLGRIGIRAERGEPRDSRLNLEEQQSLLSLWVMARSPLMIGGDLPTSRPETIQLLQNPDVLAIARSSSRNRELRREGEHVLWAADGRASTRYAAIFNLQDEAMRIEIDSADLGLPARLDGSLLELWTRATPDVANREPATRASVIELDVPPHGVRLLRYAPDQTPPD